jgi:hypothetical protein
VSAGSATITVRTADGGKTATCAVTVSADNSLTPAGLAAYLETLPANTVSNPHNIMLKVTNAAEFSTIWTALHGAWNKYVYLNLSGSTVTTIPNNAFYQNSVCETLVGITIHNRVTSIGDYAFGLCNNLTNVIISNSVISIGRMAFVGCDSLASITIPDSVTSIGSNAFDSCTSLTSVIIPNSVINIGGRAFDGCTSLTRVTFQGIISSSNFNTGTLFNPSSPFPGDLRDKFYATNANNGTPGTYTRASGSNTWTRQ